MASVTMRMSLRSVVFEGEQIHKTWTRWDGPLPTDTPAGFEARVFQTPLSRRGSIIAILDHAVNYEGDDALAKYVLLSPVFVLYTILLAILLAIRFFAAKRIVEMPAWIRMDFADTSVVAKPEQRAGAWRASRHGLL